MTSRHNYSHSCVYLIVIVILAAFVSSGCATTSTHKFGMSFLPPAPKSAVHADPLAEAPKIEATIAVAQVPSFVGPSREVPPRPSPVELRVSRADEKFRNGRLLYQQGDTDAARREFDSAIDILLGTPEDQPDRYKAERKLEELVAAIFRYDVNGLGLADLGEQAGYDRAPLEDILELTFPINPQMKPVVTQQLRATVSQLPLEFNDTVLSYINFFQSDRGRRTLLYGLKRAGRYRDLISRTLAEEGVPQELIFLAQAESGFLPRAVSNKAATGMWQFVQSRGREYGLYQTAHHDDRLDPEKATRSAARHLKDLYNKFGDWYLAIAGYNCGDGCIERAVQRTGYADFWELRSRGAIPRETANYVPIILAMTIMAKNPQAYGLQEVELDAPLEYETVKLEAATHLALVADLVERPVSELRDLNPSLLRAVAPAGFELKVPKRTASMVAARLESIPESRRASLRAHRVSSGDTLASIAKRYGTSVNAVSAANNGNEIASVGEVLLIPAAVQQVKATAKGKGKSKLTAKKSSSRKGRAVVAKSAGKKPAARSAKARPARKGLLQRASLR